MGYRLGVISKPPHYQHKVQKLKEIPKTSDLTGNFEIQSIVNISLNLQAMRSLMPSNLCSGSQQVNLKKTLLHDEGKLMSNQLTNIRVWEIFEHTLTWPARFSNYSSTKDSITFLKPRTWENTLFWEKRYLWAWNNFLPFFLTLGQRRTQISLSKPLRFWNNCLTSYVVMSAALTLCSIIKKNSYLTDKENIWPFVSYFWGWEASLLFKLRSTR